LLRACATRRNPRPPLPPPPLSARAQLYADGGDVDGLGNLTSARVWLFSATGDTVVNTGAVKAAQQLYTMYVTGAGGVTGVYTQPGEHSQQTLDYGSSCSTLGAPYIKSVRGGGGLGCVTSVCDAHARDPCGSCARSNCNYDAAGAILQWMYPGERRGCCAARAAVRVGGGVSVGVAAPRAQQCVSGVV
jgi:hypothetical protein